MTKPRIIPADRSLAEAFDRLVAVARETPMGKPVFTALAAAAGLDRRVDFRHAWLRGLDFRGEDLTGFDFTGADLRDANFIGAILTGVCWAGADTTGAIGLPKSMRRQWPDTAPPPDSDWAAARGQDPFGHWADFTIGGVTQRLRWIPPGRFQMGSPKTEEGRYSHEGPVHEVTIAAGYWLFDTPCTQALWEAVTGKNPSQFQSPTRPVETVSYADVSRFLKALNAQMPGFSLPSEAEWEYACRAGTRTATYAGDLDIIGANNAPLLDAIAWYGGNSGAGFELPNGFDSSGWKDKQYPHERAGTRPVKLKDPNAWGLYDMLGNVWEWCQDHWHDSYDGAPHNGSAWLDRSASDRVFRGGSWGDDARGVRSAFRFHIDPSYIGGALGFRCARVQKAKATAERRADGREPGARSAKAKAVSPKRNETGQ